jgi:glycosyltransferase involved in cell wall biosynthesis
MRIAYLSTFYPFRGGIAQFNALLYRQLEKHHELKAYTFSRQYPNFLFPGETQFVNTSDDSDVVSAERILDTLNPYSYLKTARIIAQFQPDLLLLRLWIPFVAPALGTVSKKLHKNGIKSICIADNILPHEARIGDLSFLKYMLRRVDGFIVMSQTVAQQLVSLKPDAKYILHPHPIYEHFGKRIDRSKACQMLNLPPEKRIILFFGFIRDYKGLDILLRSVPYLDDSYILLIAGEVYGSFKKYQSIIDELKIAHKVKLWIRYIDDQEVAGIFSAADVCVLPYRSATQSGIVQIAYNFDLPVICTNVGGLSEMVSNDSTGFVLSTHEPSEVANKIEHYFNKDLKIPFSQNISQTKVVYSWQNFAKNLVTFYNDMMH